MGTLLPLRTGCCVVRTRHVGMLVAILVFGFLLRCLFAPHSKLDESLMVRTRRNASDPVTPCSVPGVVRNFRITGSGTSRRFRWSALHSSSVCPIIGYSLQFRLINRDQCRTVGESFETLRQTTNTNYRLSQAESSLYFFSTYEVQVRGRNSAGLGVPSTQIQVTTSETAPGAPPESVSCTGIGSDYMTCSWGAVPCGNRRGNIQSYQYRLTAGTTRSQEVSSLQVAIRTLTACTAYQFQVAALRNTDIGPYSPSIQITTTSKVHGPVSNLLATAHAGVPSIWATWSAPDTSGNPCTLLYVIHYELIVRDQCEPLSHSQRLLAANQTATSTIVHGLEGYSTYNVYVKTWSKAGYSSERTATTNTVSLAAPTAAPANVTWTRILPNHFNFSWDEVPCGNRGGAISQYRYRLIPVSSGAQRNRTISSRFVVIEENPSCVNYNFQVQALLGSNGGGPYSNTIRVTTATKVHGPVSNLNATTLSDSPSIRVRWSLPDISQNKCSMRYIIEYELTRRDLCDPINHPHRVLAGNQTSTSITIHRVQAYSTYKVYVRTWNQAGAGAERSGTTNTRSFEEPSEGPTNITVTSRMRHSIVFAWSEIPCGHRHGQIRDYQTRLRALEKPYDLAFTPADTYETVNVSPSSMLYASDVLEPATKYEFLVAGVNEHGAGKWARIEAFTTVETGMDPPPRPSSDPSKSTNSTVTINVKLPLRSRYITGIQIGVKEVYSGRKMEILTTKRPTDFTRDYVAGELSKADLEETFTVGDGHTYGAFHNQPLHPDTEYDIYLGSVSRVSDTEFAVSWGEPLRVKVRANYFLPVAAVAVPIPLVIILCSTVAGVIFVRKKLGRRRQDSAHIGGVSGDVELREGPLRHAKANPYWNEEAPYEPIAILCESDSIAKSMGKPNKEKKKPVPAPRKTAACGKGLKDYPYENMPPVFVDDSVVEPDAKNNPDGAKFKKRPPKKEVLVYDTPRPIVHKVEPKAQAANPVARPSATGAHAVVPLAQFEDYIHKKKKRTYRDGNGFLKDYEDLPSPVKHACSVGKKRANKEKNRYANILPYDDTRVVLEKLPNKPNSDYVNASYIDGFDEPRKYIATQGPTKVSVDDMWRMVWQENVSKIVMLTNLRDGVKEKCDKYWPDDTTTYGNITVRLMNEVEHNGYIIREFTLAIKSQKRLSQVCQFHFTAWPGDGLPKESAKLIEFIKAVREFRPDGAGPMVVHCSTGTGRTGLFIVLDAMLDQVEKEGRVDIWNFTRSMRDKRIGVIQSALHYEFIFDTLLNTLKRAETTVKSA